MKLKWTTYQEYILQLHQVVNSTGIQLELYFVCDLIDTVSPVCHDSLLLSSLLLLSSCFLECYEFASCRCARPKMLIRQPSYIVFNSIMDIQKNLNLKFIKPSSLSLSLNHSLKFNLISFYF